MIEIFFSKNYQNFAKQPLKDIKIAKLEKCAL